MPYAEKHQLLTFEWTTALGEIGQTSLRVRRSNALDLTEVNDVFDSFAVMWLAPNTRINVEFTLKSVKAATIQVDGLYPSTFEPVYSTRAPIPGGVNSGPYYPLQVASVVSLRTAEARGLGSRGRMYLPPIAALLDASNFRWPTARLTDRLATVRAALNAIMVDVGAPLAVFSPKGTPGSVHDITSIQIGNRADIQRSRDNAVPEAYSSLAL